MPTINKKICKSHGIYTTRKCEQCIAERNKDYDKITRNKDSIKIYNSKQWKQVRVQALVRDGYRCVKCSSKDNLVVDHIVELVDNGSPYELNNLQTMCKKCHAIKTEQEKVTRNQTGVGKKL